MKNNLYDKDFRAKLRENPGFAMKELLYDDVEYKVFESNKDITYVIIPHFDSSVDLEKISGSVGIDELEGTAGTVGSIGTIGTASTAFGSFSTVSSGGSVSSLGTVSSR